MTWCGDLTEIPTDEGRFDLAGILDLCSRRCVGFAMDAHDDGELARAALCVAIAVRGFHTDYAEPCTMPRIIEMACAGRVA